jgi:hypothetical protein
VIRTERRRKNLAEIGKLRLQTFDIETNDAAARKGERYDSGRRIGLGEFNGEQIEPCVLVGSIEIAALAGQHALEAQRRPAAPIIGFGIPFRVGGAHPVKTVERHHKTAVARLPPYIGDLNQGILQVRRHYLDILAVKRNEFQFIRAGAAIHECTASLERFPDWEAKKDAAAAQDLRALESGDDPSRLYLQPCAVMVLPAGQAGLAGARGAGAAGGCDGCGGGGAALAGAAAGWGGDADGAGGGGGGGAGFATAGAGAGATRGDGEAG